VVLSLTAAFTIVLCGSNTVTADATTPPNATSFHNASANQTTHGIYNNLPMNFPSVSHEIFPNESITIDLSSDTEKPVGANWTYYLESTPSLGTTTPIKRGELIPNGIIQYKASPSFKEGTDSFIYKVQNQTSSTTGSITIYIPKPIISSPALRLFVSAVVAAVLIIAITVAAWRIISKLRQNKNPMNSSKFWDILRTSDMDPSLSVFQFFLWTIVLMFALFTVYLIRIFGGVTESIPGSPPLNLLALAGISIVTPIGSSLISSLGYPKADTTMTETSEDSQNRPPWGEMLREFGKPSLSRFQMFGWTWISIVIYLSAYWAVISRDYSNVSYLTIPDVYPVLVVLMGLSQTVFLGTKANVTNQIEITKVFPLEVPRGEQLSIFGLNFGDAKQDVWLGTHRISSVDKDLLGWSDGRIDIMIPDIPDPLRKDGYEIMIAKGGSSKIAFKGDSPIRIKILPKPSGSPVKT
jgi:hypothetical protein